MANSIAMKRLLLFAFFIATACEPESDNNALQLQGLSSPVEIIRDNWGINHIYAQNQQDLFFAQGYAAAKDRLFQFEIWRRQATGTVAEILGERELKRDIGTRLFLFRGDMKTELDYYHEDGEEIITAYTLGVNAYIEEILKTPENLPIEFKMLGIEPEHWTPEVVISRHQGLLGNIRQELTIGRAVAASDPEVVRELSWFHPKDPDLTLDPIVTQEALSENILELYNAYRGRLRFQPEVIAEEYRASEPVASAMELEDSPSTIDWTAIGSNNWVVSGERTESGFPIMANDPHRSLAVPSLRYMVHLNAPGWNVIGGGEPEIPGVSIGHNEHGAWGLTVFRTDAEDLYVYEINPDDPNQYKYEGQWESMTIINETIKVRDKEDESVELKYTRHGPVTFVDEERGLAYAVRCGWMEPGGSPYLASLRMDQATTWEEFRAACSYSNIPGENMIWADKDGNIGWQAVGIAPLRRNFSGLVPVPGDGRFEWDGYLPIKQKPNVYNPPSGYFASANQNVTPDSYKEWDAIGFAWSDPYRGDRVDEVLSGDNQFNIKKSQSLQTDYVSLPARKLVPRILEVSTADPGFEQAQKYLQDWDFELSAESVAAGIYAMWENTIRSEAIERVVPENLQGLVSPPLKRVIDWIETSDSRLGPDFISETFSAAIAEMSSRFGTDMSNWKYGQADYKHVQIIHPLSSAVSEEWKAKLNTPIKPRGGNSFTPGSTGWREKQPSGASFRMVVDTGDWDKTMGTNSPGQSGDVDSPFYMNLFENWANDEFFPMYFSKELVEENRSERVILNPEYD